MADADPHAPWHEPAMPVVEEETAWVHEAAERFEDAPGEEILAWGLERFHPKMAISAALKASVLVRPIRSAITPETMTPHAPRIAATICTARNSVTDRSEKSTIHDNGNTVTTWNNA